MKKFVKKPYPAEVIWEDAHGGSAWTPIDDEGAHSECLCSTVGWVIRNDKKAVVMCSQLGNTLTSEPNMAGYTHIPKGMVKKIRRLK